MGTSNISDDIPISNCTDLFFMFASLSVRMDIHFAWIAGIVLIVTTSSIVAAVETAVRILYASDYVIRLDNLLRIYGFIHLSNLHVP